MELSSESRDLHLAGGLCKRDLAEVTHGVGEHAEYHVGENYIFVHEVV
jgi:hypothetical protein